MVNGHGTSHKLRQPKASLGTKYEVMFKIQVMFKQRHFRHYSIAVWTNTQNDFQIHPIYCQQE